MDPIIYTIDNQIRYGPIERKTVKHCAEIQWISGVYYGGVGFGYESSYVRYTHNYNYSGNKNVGIIRHEFLTIPMDDKQRIMICLDNTLEEHIFTVIKGNLIRKTTFTYSSNSKMIQMILYNGNYSRSSDTFYIFTHKREFSNTMPLHYIAWGDGMIKTCFKKQNNLYFHCLLYITFTS